MLFIHDRVAKRADISIGLFAFWIDVISHVQRLRISHAVRRVPDLLFLLLNLSSCFNELLS